MVEVDSDYNSYIDISNILINTKRKIKSYSLYDMNNRRRGRSMITRDTSYDNLDNTMMKRSKTCADFASFNILSNQDDNDLTKLNKFLDNEECHDLKNDVKMISDMFKCIAIPSSTC